MAPILEIVSPPPSVFYNDGKARKFEVELILQGGGHGQLGVTLLYERGDRVEDQSILEAVPGNALSLRSGRQCSLGYRINQVSSKHLNRKFRLQFHCDGAVAETIPIEVKAKPPRKQKNDDSSDHSTSKRRKTDNSNSGSNAHSGYNSEPMLNALRQIESNQLHILQRISSLEQLVHRVLPIISAHSGDSPAHRSRAPLGQARPGQPNHGAGGPTSGNPDSMGLDSLCARILEQQNAAGSQDAAHGAMPGAVMPNGIAQDSGSIGGWIQDSLSALTWNLNKAPHHKVAS